MVGVDRVAERFQFFKIKRNSGLTEQNRRNNDVYVSYVVHVAHVVEIAYVAHNRYVQDVQAFEETQEY
jgi:hypothetical protein